MRRPAALLAVIAAGVAIAGAVAVGSGDPDGAPTAAGTPGGPSSPAAPPPPSPSSPSAAPTSAPDAGIAVAEPSPAPEPSPVLGAFDGARAMEVAVGLGRDVGVRVAGTRGDYLARRSVALALTRAGWSVHADAVDLPQGGRSANLVATLGPPPDPEAPQVVVGAHLDTVPGSPGANDNATGVGVLVALAEELADEAATMPLPVVLVAFAAEEYQAGTGIHHVGSEHLAAARPGVVAMLGIDMVGDGPTTRIVGLAGTDDTLVRRVADVAARVAVGEVTTEARGDISDHGPFARRGVPAAFLWSGPTDFYHDATDTVDRLDPADVQRAGDLALAWLRDLRPADADGLQPPP